MKKILLSWKGFENNKIFTYNDSNNFNGPWKHLKNKLSEIDYDISTIDTSEIGDADFILFIDETSLGIPKKPKNNLRNLIKSIIKPSKSFNGKSIYDKAIDAGKRSSMAIMLWEPAVIDPDNYTQELYDRFDTVLTWNDDLVDDKKFFKFLHPHQEKNNNYTEVKFEDKKMLVNISMNKYSNHTNDLYRERRSSIEYFEKNSGDQFDLFGYGWNTPKNKCERYFPFLVKKYKNYRGTCEDKIDVLSKYKFSICYENIKNEKGWITEKIFDCFHAKNIPIYWGASNITDYIPENTFIDRRKFKDNQELLEFIESITKEQYDEYLRNISLFLNSDDYKKFSPENFAKNIINNLRLK